MSNINQLIAELSAEITPVKKLANPLVSFAKWMLGCSIYIGVLLLCSHLRGDISSKLASPLFLAEIGLLICMAATAGLSFTILAYPDTYQKRWLVFTPFLPLALFFIVLFLEWLEDQPPAPPPEHGWHCLLCIICYAILPACWIFYRLRKMASTHVNMAGSVALLGATSIGCLALRLTEATDSITHIIEWHYLPMLTLSAFGLWLGKKFLQW